MTISDDDRVLRDWARLGVLLSCRPAVREPDLERLLLDTARACPANARLFVLAVTWLAAYGNFVARHRLKRLVATELEPEHQAALGLILASAVRHGASRDLLIAASACAPARPARPLFNVHRASGLGALAERSASALSREWGVLAPEAERKPDAVRPVGWLLRHNPAYRDRICRKGDLRCSILETLRHDAPGGVVRSEAELARLSGANRSAVRRALDALMLEGEVEYPEPAANRRDHPVRLRRAA